MRKISSILMTVLLGALCLTGCGSTDNNTAADRNVSSAAVSSPAADAESNVASDNEDSDLLSGKHHIKIKVKDYGTISVELDADVAPITVTNFVDLAKDGFYDGLTFHRIISGFMIQGGDPLGNGTGGSDKTIKGEFSENGVENSISHVRGTISMARSQDYDSASSQFFIMHKDNPGLDGQYAAFGTVTKGMEVVDKICEDTQVEDENGTVAAENQPVIKSIKVID
ncbi:MAG TPA: peptidylprolyl isomerase [Lachnospiraceae bacterium]|jgi:peptidyl-prolyl cis-trans isomerase B (cyclophilin B)|nr:peptidylprolyl isomerase [Roseburia sp.]HCS14970.1 peptidylprolyl isomerase [Lachnospiraceae bacterium]